MRAVWSTELQNQDVGTIAEDPGIFAIAVLRCRDLVDDPGGLKGVSAESKPRSAACRHQVFRPSACRAGAAARFPLATEKHVPALAGPGSGCDHASATPRARRRLCNVACIAIMR